MEGREEPLAAPGHDAAALGTQRRLMPAIGGAPRKPADYGTSGSPVNQATDAQMPSRTHLRHNRPSKTVAQGADSNPSVCASPAPSGGAASNGGARAGRATGRSVARLFEAYRRVGAEYNLPVLVERRGDRGGDLAPWQTAADAEALIDRVVSISPGVAISNWMRAYEQLLAPLPPACTSSIVHLAYTDDEMRGATWDHPDWARPGGRRISISCAATGSGAS
jgi:hypothetical protein